MGRLLQTAKHAFSILLQNPKLFLPKLLIAAMFGIGMLLTADLYLRVAALGAVPPSAAVQAELMAALPVLLALLVYFLLTELIDVLINAMYPSMVSDHYAKRPISFTAALKASAKKFFVVVPAVLATIAIFFIIAMPFSFLAALATRSGDAWLNAFAWLGMLVVVFITAVSFYMLYPVSVLERRNFIGAIKQTFSISRKNLGDVSKASLIPFGVSLLNFALAFLASNPVFLLAFILLRVLVAVFYTYHMVLNPSIYIEYAGGAANA